MGSYDWRYNRLPSDKIPEVRKALAEHDLITLFNLNLDYKLSRKKYCCPDPAMVPFFDDLITKYDINNS
jgi:hypothetical protein